ncbi:MAG TPA: SCO1664 family protein [Streptosporangiaceae bacterium]|nr:SCO1664 family protein [Streptosporangiaceae bacterium]
MPEPTRRRHRQRQRRAADSPGDVRPAAAAGDASPSPGGDGAGPAGPAEGAPARSDAEALDLLANGALEVEGRLVVASNATLYCTVRDGDREAACVYKPVAGERPLWDFPAGSLAGREVSAYHVSVAAGWYLVPPTVFRDGPFGPGMCQLWIESDESVDVMALARSTDHLALREMAVFDAVINNADRKIGHLLPDRQGHLYGCDHGVCFGEDYKLRTVLWQWRGRRLPAAAVAALGRLQAALAEGDLLTELDRWLSPAELEATRQRVELLLEHKVHPFPPDDWPAVPWPPY